MGFPPGYGPCPRLARGPAPATPGETVPTRWRRGRPPDRSGGFPPDPNDALRRPGLVPEAGLEPAWGSPHAPQTGGSAHSTTPAAGGDELSILESPPGRVQRPAPLGGDRDRAGGAGNERVVRGRARGE